jgi:hypothetical protein
MAPEIANGRYGREIDTYALGVILYEMLTGNVPFEGESVGEVLMKHLTAEPDLTPLAEPFRDIVRRALAKDPDHRVKSVGEMLALLPGGAGEAASAAVPPAAMDQGRGQPYPQHHAAADAFAPSPQVQAVSAEEIEEPIWKAIRVGAGKFRRAWHGENLQEMHPLAKALVIFALVIGGLWFFAEVIAISIPALICYGVYYAIWAMFIRPGMRRRGGPFSKLQFDVVLTGSDRRNDVTAAWQQPAEPPLSAAERYADRVRRRRLRPNWRDRAHQELTAKPYREKFSELTGSMLMAAIMAAVAALVAPIMLANGASSQGLATHLWLALVGTLGSWAILVPTKFTEGRIEDQVPLRIVLLLLGGLVGAAAWGLAESLIVQVPNSRAIVPTDPGLISHTVLGWNVPEGTANPSLAVFVTYFAFLFLLLRWWRQAEYTRSSRLSLWSVATCVFWAWLLQLFWWFPQPAGMMVAGVIAFATQMASPWLPPSGRRALSEQVDQIV